MKKVLNFMWKLLLYLWQLPQIIIGLVILLFIKKQLNHQGGIDYFYSKGFPGGITLGEIIIVGTNNITTIKHEYGHVLQSRYLGPLYLFVIGIPSILHAALGDIIGCCKKHKNGYYHFYTEKWADELSGIKR